MNQTQLKYLQRVVNYACIIKSSDGLSETVKHIKVAKHPVYQMVRDIVCDVRFYSVIQNELFWRQYSCAAVSRFIDSLTSEDWSSEKRLTGKKENFLNEWLAKHILGISTEEQHEIEQELDLETTPSVAGSDDKDGDAKDTLMLKFDQPLGGGNITDETCNNGIISDGLPKGIKNYLKNSQKQKEKDAQNGASPGLHEEPHKADAKYISSIDPTLVELAKKIGRSGSVEHESNGRFQTASRSDISGITTGDNLNSLLPTELALLTSPQSEKVFLRKFVQKQLQIFSSASSSLAKGKKAGPIYICIDTSSSMQGQPEVTAKTLALAIAIIAQRDKRPICLIKYSFNLSFFILTNLEHQKLPFLSFLSHSYGGGNDEQMMFQFVFDTLPCNRRFRKYADQFSGADMLIISDFKWSHLGTDTLSKIEAARSQGLRMFAFSVNMMQRCCKVDLYNQVTLAGHEFYMSCDCRYMCDNNRCFEYDEKMSI